MSKLVLGGWALLALAACGGQTDGGGSGSGGTGGAAASGGTATGGTGGTAPSGGGGTGGAAASGGGGTTSGGGGTAGTGTGGWGAVGGSAGASCDVLATAYQQALVQAKACNPFIDMNECTATVAVNQLPCPCGPTYVNPKNSDAIKALNDIAGQWNAQQCGAGIMCPDIACLVPDAGVCVPDATNSGGFCQDESKNG